MQIAVELPEDVADILKAAWRDLPRGCSEPLPLRATAAEH